MLATIRRLRLDDVEEVEELYQEYMKMDISRRASILENLEKEDSEILVAEVEGKVIQKARNRKALVKKNLAKCG